MGSKETFFKFFKFSYFLIAEQGFDVVVPEAVAVVLAGGPACAGGVLLYAEPFNVNGCAALHVLEAGIDTGVI